MAQNKPKTPRAPADLRDAGKAQWRELYGTMEFDAWELPTVREVCRLTDELAELRQALTDDGRAFVRGSQGQDVANPLHNEIRQTIALRAKLLATIVPAASSDPQDMFKRSHDARVAAHARWGRYGPGRG